MPIPEVRTQIANGLPALVPDDIASTCAIIGASSSGVTTTSNLARRGDIIAEYGDGPLVRAGVHCIDIAKRAVLLQKCAASNPGAYDTLNASEFGGTASPVVVASEVPTNENEFYVKFEAGGTIGTDGITYRKSTADGRIDLSGLLKLGVSSRITFAPTGGAIELDPPASSLVALAVELRADRLAHYANGVAHNAADTDAAAIITEGVPATNAAALLVINQVRLADIAHADNATVHDSFDSINRPTLPAATTLQEARLLAIHLKARANAHNAAAFAAASAALLAATATVAAPVTILAAALLAPGLTQLANYPAQITFTTAGSTPSDAPATATIVGTAADGSAQTESGLALSQIAGAVTSVQRWKTITSIAYVAADGTGATIAIGIVAAAHNSADVTNTITTADPSAGTVLAGDIIRCKTFAPTPSTAELAAAFEELAISDFTPGFVLLPGRTPASYAATITAGLDRMREEGKPCRCIVQARAQEPSDATMQGFRNNLENETDNISDTRILWASTDTLCTTSEGATVIVPAERFTGYAINLAAYRITIPFWQTTWQVGKGDLPGVRLVDGNGVLVGWNEPQGISDVRLQLLYRVPNALKKRITVAAQDFTLAGSAERLKRFQPGLVEDEIVRVLEAYHWDLIGVNGEFVVTSPGKGKFKEESLRQSLQNSAAARLRAREGLQAGVTDLDAADLVALNPEVSIVQDVVYLEFFVNWTPTYPIGRITTIVGVRTGA